MVMSLMKTGPLLLVLAAMADLCHGSGSSPLEDPCFKPISAVTCRLSQDDSGEACSWCSSELLPSKCLPPSMAKFLPTFLFTCDGQSNAAADANGEAKAMTVQQPPEVSGDAPALPEEATAAAGSDPAEDYCVTATSADECRSMVDKTGETCSWCTSESIPATCLPPALAKYLPPFVFTCDNNADAEEVETTTALEQQQQQEELPWGELLDLLDDYLYRPEHADMDWAEQGRAAIMRHPAAQQIGEDDWYETKLFEEHKAAMKDRPVGQEEVDVTGGDLGEWCVSATTAEECRSSVDEGGTTCVWCTCQSVPSECVPAAIAKKLPKVVFNCDNNEDEDEDGTAATLGQEERENALFREWKEKHGVTYADEEEERERMGVFRDNLRQVADDAVTPRSYSLGLNRFSDMTWEEFQATRLGFGSALSASQNCSATHVGSQYRALGLSKGRAPPAARDWRDLGAVSVVKNQDHCGSCWTFSTTGCLESHHYLRTGEMVLLSEQQLLDCAGAYDNHGCNGGLPSHAFEYIASAGGLDTEEAYPYMAEESGLCSFADRGIGADVMRSVNITFQDERELLEAVGNTGPVSVAFQVAPDFKAYAGGVYDNPSCSTLPEQVNHAVLCVGYGTTEEGVDYWIIKNSWGPEWGLDGFFHMARGKNMCGVADCASFPLVP
ncbi:unnamed protein product [Ectocarpus sp. CCAP 1310/34]|nr:unnamed protein product [Ectocarpus sp. CCAP 1310/34]